MGERHLKRVFWRLGISLAAVVIPIVFLLRGIYGSFLFAFSIPIIWQIGLTGNSLRSLGLQRDNLGSSILSGIINGCFLGLIGGSILKLFGLTGYALSGFEKLQWSFGPFRQAFTLQKELGYRLLTDSGSPQGMWIYLAFSIFIIGLGEELFWRGFIQRKIAKYIQLRTAILFTAVLFALVHFYIFLILPFDMGILILVLMGIAGVFWGYLFERHHNIWSVAVSHGLTAFIIWKYYFFKV
jgi:membrane protease YdiL (CAAX protease family)